MSATLTLEKIEKAIQKAEPEEQRQLLVKLPHLLKISFSDLVFLKLSERSFDFWNNTDDEIYDSI